MDSPETELSKPNDTLSRKIGEQTLLKPEDNIVCSRRINRPSDKLHFFVLLHYFVNKVRNGEDQGHESK